MNEWISVKDKLPVPNRAVLAVIRYERPDRWFTFALLTRDDDTKSVRWRQFWGDKYLEDGYQVTHWMELPCAPGEADA